MTAFWIETIGVIAAVLTTSGFVPQVVKTLKTKDVNAISLSMYIVLFIGIIFWLTYGFLIDSFAIKIANTVSGVLVLTMIILKLVYSKK